MSLLLHINWHSYFTLAMYLSAAYWIAIVLLFYKRETRSLLLRAGKFQKQDYLKKGAVVDSTRTETRQRTFFVEEPTDAELESERESDKSP